MGKMYQIKLVKCSFVSEKIEQYREATKINPQLIVKSMESVDIIFNPSFIEVRYLKLDFKHGSLQKHNPFVDKMEFARLIL